MINYKYEAPLMSSYDTYKLNMDINVYRGTHYDYFQSLYALEEILVESGAKVYHTHNALAERLICFEIDNVIKYCDYSMDMAIVKGYILYRMKIKNE